MKKFLFGLIGLAALFSLSFIAYGWDSQAGKPDGAASASGRVLVAYYSRSGNTKAVAERIAQKTGGRLLEIKPVTPYPEDYQACVDQAKVEIRKGVKPAITHDPVNGDDFDIVFIGSPNWWSSIAPPVSTFLSELKARKKPVALFITHGGGGKAFTERDTRALLPDADFRGTLALPGEAAAASGAKIDAWVDSVYPKGK